MPGASLPLHIFEPRYRQLTVDLVTGVVPDKQFGVVAMREGFTHPERVHVEAMLAFFEAWDRQAPMLIHCYAGVSRSTAASKRSTFA